MKKPLKNPFSVAIGGRKKVFPQQIVLLEAEVNYTKLHLVNGDLVLVATTLKQFEERLHTFNFFRSHKSFLINLSCINEVNETTDSVLLKNDLMAKISRRKRASLMQELTKI